MQMQPPLLLSRAHWAMRNGEYEGMSKLIQKAEMSSAETELWRTLIRSRIGLYFTDGRLYFLRQRLWERMQKHNMRSFTEYYNFVTFSPEGDHEWKQLKEVLLNNETSFFRHLPSYKVLLENVLPEIVATKQRIGSKTLSVWSAGCSGGQEPYSLAMALFDRLGDTWDLRVWASDISESRLAWARAGKYNAHDTRLVTDHYRKRYLRTITDERQLMYEVKGFIRDRVHFTSFNLAHEAEGWLAGHDIIFCQNVLIYFEREDRIAITKRLCRHLNPGGYLFLGPAEVVGLKAPGIEQMRIPEALVYRRV